MGLLKITTIPIEYEIKIERAKLRVKENEVNESAERIRQLTLQKQSSDRRLAANPRAVNRAERASSEFQAVARQRSAGIPKATPVNAAMPQAAGSLAESEIAAAINNFTPMSTSQIQVAMADLNYRSDAEYSSFDENSTDDFYVESYDLKSELQNQWHLSKQEMEFVPGRFKMEIKQFPEVKIEYTGGFRYVPPSAAPDYEDKKQ